MRQTKAYYLYSCAEKLREEIIKRGFSLQEDCKGNYVVGKKIIPTNIRSNGILNIGEIINDKFLIIYSDSYRNFDRRYGKAISKLQKLAKEFKIR